MLKFIMESVFLNESLKSAKEFATKSNISQEIFDKFNELDTTPTKKLINQILKWYVGDSSIIDTLEDVKNKVDTFIKFSGGRIKDQIEKFKTYEEFTTFITPFLEIETKSEKKDKLAGQYKKIFENSSMLIILPFTHDASCVYGAKTKWCTTAKTASHFNQYQGYGTAIYYVLNKIDNNENNPFHKMAVVVEEDGSIDECYDTFDSSQYTGQILNWIRQHGIPTIEDVFVPLATYDEYILTRLDQYKKMKSFNVDKGSMPLYKKLIELNKLDEAFPVLQTIEFASYPSEKFNIGNICPIIPSSTKRVILFTSEFSDFININKEGITVYVYIRGKRIIGKVTNCDKLNAKIVFEGDEANYRGKLEMIKHIILSPFESVGIKFDTYGESNLFHFKDKVRSLLKNRTTGGIPSKVVQKTIKKKK